MDRCSGLPGLGSSVGWILAIAVISIVVGVGLVRTSRRTVVAVVAAMAFAGAVLLAAAPVGATADCPPSTTAETSVPPSTTAATTTTTTAPLPRLVALGFSPTGSPPLCNVTITLTNFAPNQSISVSLAHTSNFGANPAQSGWVWNVMTDGSGSASYTPFTYSDSPAESAQFSATADGVSSPFVLLTC